MLAVIAGRLPFVVCFIAGDVKIPRLIYHTAATFSLALLGVIVWTRCAEFLQSMQKYVPFDLRPKKTRAIRKRMTKHQVSCSGLGVHYNLQYSTTLTCKL